MLGLGLGLGPGLGAGEGESGNGEVLAGVINPVDPVDPVETVVLVAELLVTAKVEAEAVVLPAVLDTTTRYE